MAINIIIHDVHSKFTNLSDSLSTVKSLQNQSNPGDIAFKIQTNLKKASDLSVIIIWILGHSGV